MAPLTTIRGRNLKEAKTGVSSNINKSTFHELPRFPDSADACLGSSRHERGLSLRDLDRVGTPWRLLICVMDQLLIILRCPTLLI